MKQTVLFTVVLILIALSAFSQHLTWDKRYRAIRTVDSIMKIYTEKLNLRDPSTPDSISEKAVKRFKSIFASDADVFDDVNPSYFDSIPEYWDQAGTQPFEFRSRSLTDYLSRTKQNYPEGLLEAAIINLVPGYNDLALQNVAYMAVERKVKAYAANGWYVIIHDTLLITLQLYDDFKTASIIRITPAGRSVTSVNYKINNDADQDLVINEKDKCPDIPGYYRNNGCQPPKGPLATLSLGGGFGYQESSFNPGAYQSNSQSSKFIQSDGFDTRFRPINFNAFAQLEFFVGRERHYGVTFGLLYSHYETKLHLDHYMSDYESSTPFQTFDNKVNFNGTDSDGDSYKEIITSIGEVNENLFFNYLTPQVLLKFKTQMKNNLDLKIGAGIGWSFDLIGTSKGDKDNHFKYETRIASLYDSVSHTYYSGYSPVSSETDIVFTETDIEGYNGDPSTIFSDNILINDYNLSLYNGIDDFRKNKLNFSGGVSFIFQPTLVFKLSTNDYMNIGLMMVFEPKTHSNKVEKENFNDYILTNKVSTYYSLANGIKAVGHTYIGITLGYSFGVVKGYKDVNLRKFN